MRQAWAGAAELAYEAVMGILLSRGSDYRDFQW